MMRLDDLHPAFLRDTSQATARLVLIFRGIGDRFKMVSGLSVLVGNPLIYLYIDDILDVTLNGRWHWNRRPPLKENDLKWKTTLNGGQPLIEDNLKWKKTLLYWIKRNILNTKTFLRDTKSVFYNIKHAEDYQTLHNFPFS